MTLREVFEFVTDFDLKEEKLDAYLDEVGGIFLLMFMF